jgi:hypothetical protein
MISSSRHFHLVLLSGFLVGFSRCSTEGWIRAAEMGWSCGCALCLHYSQGRCRFAIEKRHDYHYLYMRPHQKLVRFFSYVQSV